MKRIILIAVVVLLAEAAIPSNAKESSHDKKSGIPSVRNDPHSKKARKKMKAKEVNMLSENHFLSDFGNIPDVTWERTSEFDQATFKKDGKKMIAYYDPESNLVGTTTDVKFADLPKNAQKEINSKYKNYTVGAVIYFDDDERNETNMILYGTEFEDSDNYFVELSNNQNNIVLEVTTWGNVSFFKKI
jgi:hypothetical protein